MEELIKELIAAPSINPKVKAPAEAYLAAVGTDDQNAAADKLVEALEWGICTIDEEHDFAESDYAKQSMGEESAAKFAASVRARKAAGEQWCDCPACVAGKKIYDSKSELYK